MTDVARHADVSVGTVSRVLNNHASVDVTLRDRVRSAMSELGYRPDTVARSMRTRQTMSIGCLVPSLTVPYYAQPIAAAEQTLYARGYTMTLVSSYGELSREVELLSFFRNRAVDGLLATVWPELDEPVREQAAHIGVPVVLLQRSVTRDYDAVGVDYRDGLMKSLGHLAGLGHRRIGIVVGRGGIAEARGAPPFSSLHAEFGLEADPALTHFCGISDDLPFIRTLDMLALGNPPTAIVSGTSQMPGILRALQSRSVSVPGEMSLVSLGETDLTALHVPPISAVKWDNAEVGRTAADLLLRRIAGNGPTQPAHYMVRGELVLRASSAPPGKGSRA